MKRRGVILLELLVALAVAAILSVGLMATMDMLVSYQTRVPENRDKILNATNLDDRLRELISAAFVDQDEADTGTYFIASTEEGDAELEASTSPILTFTVVGRRMSSQFMESEETDFEARNEAYGPVGGITEVSLSTTAVGDAADRTGLFLREQTPSDEDDTQGGFESVFDERVISIGFEFFDGTDWTSTWDTSTGERRIPSLVRVHYRLSSDEEEATEHLLTVRLRNSDVTPETPLQSTAVQQ